MHDDVGAERDRPGQDRRRDGAVDGKTRAGAVGDLGGGGDVGDRPCRIGRALDPDELGPAGLDRGGERVRRARIDKIDGYSAFSRAALQPVAQAPIHDLRRNHMIARAQA